MSYTNQGEPVALDTPGEDRVRRYFSLGVAVIIWPACTYEGNLVFSNREPRSTRVNY